MQPQYRCLPIIAMLYVTSLLIANVTAFKIVQMGPVIFPAALVIKVSYEILAIPLTYVITNYLKRVENEDHYDYQTNFNPFRLKIER